MTNEQRDRDYVVIWDGSEKGGLIGDRDSKPTFPGEAMKRAYNFSGRFKGLFKGKTKAKSEALEPSEPKIDTFGDGNE